MQVQTYDLSGRPGTIADLYTDKVAQLWLDTAPILAVTVSGSTVMLTLSDRLVLLNVADYQQLFAYSGVCEW